MNALRLPDQQVKLAVLPGAAGQFVRGAAREYLEVDFGVGVGGDHVNGTPGFETMEGLPAEHQRLGAKEPARVDLAVCPLESRRVA